MERLRIVPDRSKDLPGISGGPVIDLESGLVVAVEGSCRGRRILASEIKRTTPAWPDDVRRSLALLENVPTDLRDQANALLETPRRPWDPERLPPGALLRADCAVAVPFHGRDRETADLGVWCKGPAALGVRLYTGAGGMGKTRLFLEVCDIFKAEGWRAGFLRSEAAQAPTALWSALVRQTQPMLLVADYAESRRGEIVPLLREMSQTPAGLVRIVLLARAAGDWWEQMKREGDGVGDLLQGPATRWHSLRPLAMTREERLDSYWAAARTFAGALGRLVPTTSPGDLEARHFESALLLHMSALAAIDGVQVKGEQGILDYVLGRERRFWSRQATAKGLSPLLENAIAQAMAVITLGGGARDAEHADAILDGIPLLRDQQRIVRHTVVTLLHEAYPGEKWIEPVLPDLLGEHLVQEVMGPDDGTLLDLVFGPPEDQSEAPRR